VVVALGIPEDGISRFVTNSGTCTAVLAATTSITRGILVARIVLPTMLAVDTVTAVNAVTTCLTPFFLVGTPPTLRTGVGSFFGRHYFSPR
jgi:hypothetical protein